MLPHPLFALGLPHGAEWLYILIGVIILFGADKLPKLARGLGKSMGEFKKAKDEFEKEIHNAANTTEVKPQTDQNLIAGTLPQPITPTPTGAVAPAPVDELTKKS
jgi:sec-independent protein translocase protein TatA